MRKVLATLAVAAAATAGLAEVPVIIDFAAHDTGWPSIDDVVMGGVSQSSMSIVEGVAVFSGVVSFENNGGFASVRSRPQARDLSRFRALVLTVRGDGKRYGFRLRTDDAFDGVSYQAQLGPPSGEWTDVVIPFSDFVPVFRGRRVADHPPLDPSRVMTMGFMISRQEGPFRLEVRAIRGLEP